MVEILQSIIFGIYMGVITVALGIAFFIVWRIILEEFDE